jgi:uncharacterized membrane protein
MVMKDLFNKVKNTIISGIVLFLPVFILVAIFQKVYGFLFGFGHKLTGMLGLDKVEGFDFAPVLTTVLLIVVLYLFGLLVRFSTVTKVKEWIENNVLVYIPTYSKYKAKMMAKLQPGQDLRQPAMVEMQDGLKPCLLVSSESGNSTIFLPSTPDTDLGEVWIVDSKRVTEVSMTLKEFKTAMLLSGKGLKFN